MEPIKPFKFTPSVVNDFTDAYLDSIRAKEEEILKMVAQHILGREPIIDDAKRLTKYVTTRYLSPDYDLLWDGVLIGRVVFTTDQVGFITGLEFRPKNHEPIHS